MGAVGLGARQVYDEVINMEVIGDSESLGGLNMIIIILVVVRYNECVDLDCGQGLLHIMPGKRCCLDP